MLNSAIAAILFFIGSDLNPQSLLEPYIRGKQVMIVTNTTVAPLYLEHYVTAIEALGKNSCDMHFA